MRMMILLLVVGGVIRGILASQVEIGWGEVDITPPPTRKIPLDGQYYQRIAKGVHLPIMFTAVAVRNGDDYFLTGSIDNVSVREPWMREVRSLLKKRIPGLDVSRVSINAIHTHCAPMIGSQGLLPEASRRKEGNDDIWGTQTYGEFATPRVVEALVRAWKGLKPGSVARAKGHASVGHCRISMYRDGHGEMYGETARPDFAGMSDGEDPTVGIVFTHDKAGKKTGAIFNVCCPAQVLEVTYRVSSDIAGALRRKMKARYGDGFGVIYQPAAAGCQSPRDLVRGHREPTDGWHEDTCDLLSDRLVKCAEEAQVFPAETNPVVRCSSRRVTARRRRVTAGDVAAAKKELSELRSKRSDKEAFSEFLAEVKANENKGGPGPYDSKYHPFVLVEIAKGVLQRAADQDERPTLDYELNVMRLGDVAFVTCPFEPYLLYGQVVKARSPAEQTFIMELCCGDYGYIPSPVVVKSGAYGSGVNNGEIGPDGGYQFCDEAVVGLRRLFR